MAIYNNLDGTTRAAFSVGTGNNRVDIRTNTGQFEARNFGGDWQVFQDKLTANTTINLTAAVDDTAAKIQAKIDAIPKNLGGKFLTVQFGDGTYTLEAAVTFRDFFNGTILIYGNASDNTASETKSVTLDSSAATCHTILVQRCATYIDVQYLKVKVNTTSSTGYSAIYFSQCTYGAVYYCFLLGTGTSYGNGISSASSSNVIAQSNYFSNVKYGFNCAYTSKAYISTNYSSTGTEPVYGAYASLGSIIFYNDLFTGSTANAGASTGGVVTKSWTSIDAASAGTFTTIKASGDITLDASYSIHQNTSDGSDTGVLSIGAGGAISTGRGAYISLYGADHGTYPNSAYIRSGTGGKVIFDQGGVIMSALPTSDPAVAGALWCDTANGRVVKVSAG